MKKIVLTTILALFVFCNQVNAAVDAAKAESFVKDVTHNGLSEIIDSDVSIAEKDKRFEKLFNEALDLDFIGQFVLGRYWRSATDTQKKDFIAVYRKLNVLTWSKRFDDFKGHNFVFKGTTPSSSANQIFVDSQVPMDQGNPAAVVWRVRQTGKTFKIVDIIIENVSLAITARNEYSAFVKNSPDGVDGLIKDLRRKVDNMQTGASK